MDWCSGGDGGANEHVYRSYGVPRQIPVHGHQQWPCEFVRFEAKLKKEIKIVQKIKERKKCVVRVSIAARMRI